jgi:plastocyanin
MRSKLALSIAILLLSAAPALLRAQREAREDIRIQNRAFAPAKITVKKGETVTWKNYDDLDHTVDAEDGSFSSGTIKKNKTFSHTFKKPGKYAYSCHLHPRMKGLIVVE